MKNLILLSCSMNINRVLKAFSFLLFLLVIVTIVNYNHSKKDRNTTYELRSNSETLMKNVCYIPEIIRSHERAKDSYDKNILFFRYINNTCSSCLDSYLAEILTLQEEIGKDNIWIFPAYPDGRESRIRLSNELAKYNYRNIPSDSLYIPIFEGEKLSYFAFINNEGEIDMVFIPDKDHIQEIRNYFIEIKKLLQKAGRN
jgi:hypothetical protein